MDLADMDLRPVTVLIDPGLAALPPATVAPESLEEEKIDHAVFDRVRVERTDASFREAIDFANSLLQSEPPTSTVQQLGA